MCFSFPSFDFEKAGLFEECWMAHFVYYIDAKSRVSSMSARSSWEFFYFYFYLVKLKAALCDFYMILHLLFVGFSLSCMLLRI